MSDAGFPHIISKETLDLSRPRSPSWSDEERPVWTPTSADESDVFVAIGVKYAGSPAPSDRVRDTYCIGHHVVEERHWDRAPPSAKVHVAFDDDVEARLIDHIREGLLPYVPSLVTSRACHPGPTRYEVDGRDATPLYIGDIAVDGGFATALVGGPNGVARGFYCGWEHVLALEKTDAGWTMKVTGRVDY